jgi:hypothetical protein
MSEITREQYDKAVKIRANGYKCHGICCLNCPSPEPKCKNCSPDNKVENIYQEWVDSAISTYETEHPEEFGPGDGWRLLGKGEAVKEGDEILMHDGWKGVLFAGITVKDAMFRRRISKPRIYTYEDVTLPEVQALVGKMVYASDWIHSMVKGTAEKYVLKEIIKSNDGVPYALQGGGLTQFICAINEPPKVRLTRAELIAIAAKEKGVNPEQIVVEE